jgi:hypothetical protein
MNKKQKVVFLVGIGIIVIMGLVPPWYYQSRGPYPSSPGGYGFILSTPYHIGDAIDVTRLFIQWAMVAIATAVIMWAFKDDNREVQKVTIPKPTLKTTTLPEGFIPVIRQTSDIDKANNRIKIAYIGGFISALLTLVVYIVRNDLAYMLDVIIALSLTFGIYKKSRTCAVILIIYFTGFKVFQLYEAVLKGNKATIIIIMGIIVASIFIYCFVQGIRGTFAYHKLVKEEQGS